MKRIRGWHGRWMLIAAVLGLSVGGNGQWADRREQPFRPAIAPGSLGWAGNGRANGAECDAGLWPEPGASGPYRVIDACRYDRQLQREHDLILCEGHRVLWRFGEQLREEALDSIRWSAAGGVVGRTVKTTLKSARQLVHHAHNAPKKKTSLLPARSPWPGNSGFIEGTVERKYLMPGEVVDRYGFGGGRFVSPAGTSVEARALRPGTENLPFNAYRVVKPIEVKAGGVQPWFGQPGYGTQYELPVSISVLLKRGFIEPVTP